MNKNDIKFRDMCGALYDGGWRKKDRELLIETYILDPQEADAICEVLAEIEGIENGEQ